MGHFNAASLANMDAHTSDDDYYDRKDYGAIQTPAAPVSLHVATLLPTDAHMAASFDELLADVAALLESTKQQKPLDKDELRFWKAQHNALNKAQYHWAAGVRPMRCGACWLVPSASLGGALVHRLCQLGGIWICNCMAGERGVLCWHHMTVNVIERAAELESLEEDEAERRLSLKISETRARYMVLA